MYNILEYISPPELPSGRTYLPNPLHGPDSIEPPLPSSPGQQLFHPRGLQRVK